MGEIKVDYATIERAAEDCRATEGELAALFDQLKQDLQPLISSWSGDAMTMYEQHQREWDNAFEELKVVLNQIAIALPEIRDGYQATDKGVEGLF
ncbi:WXG100 family type VII secretion target [Amycolatopsis suaedae]|uniref:ESAT-6-like protein n=1 Tax=Amycolatopsis suaedae TaxID=2510978 RepID=A0A4Q7JA20_9PSEU|nr:WXG100 family type VII secretion target [Amycolatopsis suaedae]RZQ64087.1 WXG100 family type VII secretion target [Amycolatopsis suaedae]